MARSSRRRGAKIPGVSTKMSCDTPSTVMPRISARVVCTLGVTMEILAPTSAFNSVDLPAFGAPISATTPQLVGDATGRSSGGNSSAIEARGPHTLPGQHGRRRRLLGSPLGSAGAFGRSKLRELNSNTEFGVVIGPGARHLAISWRRQSARLCPFLQDCFRIARWLRLCLHARLPKTFDESRRLRIAAVQIRCADQSLAHVGENGGTLAGTGIDL